MSTTCSDKPDTQIPAPLGSFAILPWRLFVASLDMAVDLAFVLVGVMATTIPPLAI